MKKRTKLMLIAAALAVGAPLLASLAYLGRFNYEISKFRPLPTGRVNADILAVHDGYVNFFLLRAAGSWVAFDAGVDSGNAARQLAELRVDPASVSAVFLTHSDADHIAALGLFSAAAVYLGERERPLLDGRAKRAFVFGNRLDHPFLPLEDGSRVDADGLDVQAIATPGHTIGSMSYLVGGKYLFSGDTLSLADGKAGLFNSFFNMDDRAEAASLGRLSRLTGVSLVLSAHYGAADDDGGKAFEGRRP